jgi:chemotaxis protein CheD
MNHYMLPFWNGDGLASPKYGNISIEALVENMIQMGSRQKDLVAKIFGGAHQFSRTHASVAVGDRNIQVAETMLKTYNIPIVALSVGGTQGRKISFNTATGVVLMKYIVT